MSCTNPYLAHRLADGSIKFLNRDEWSIARAEYYFGKDNVFFIPCGKCSACRLQKRKEYAVRCAMEAKSYGDQVSFITLTYDDEHLKSYLVKRDLIYFIKKVRNKGFKVRYFGCGEYGATTKRPHYHLILFGFLPNDLKLLNKSASGQPLFTSKVVSDLWKKGFCTVQHFSPEVAGYVAGYVNKKLGLEDGFLVMSKKPGLGYQYMFDNLSKFQDFDFVCDDFGNIKKVHSPRYFDKICERLGIDLTMTKQKRLEAICLANQSEMYQSGLERESLLRKKQEESERKERKLVRKL